jgi:uroporphyrin-III C-methyltransferase / precorrin-2 dehydrogenase / sirohydrochlorin ferrochelatase
MRHLDPKETRPARMRALAVLPVFFDLRGRLVLVVGCGEALIWKAELLAAAGADVTVCAPFPSTELAALAATPPAGKISILGRDWQPSDLAGAVLALGALKGAEAADFATAARAQGVPVNIVDTPELSTFSFGSIVNRSPVVVGISTAGAAPVLGQAIRGKIEALLHPALSAWATAAGALRARLNAQTEMGAGRRDVWRCFADRALAARAPPEHAELDKLSEPPSYQGGSVVLVGAGPGDPELLTVKALRALQSADVILYDRLVSPEILELARREARRILVGKTGHAPSCQQEDINALMLLLARKGQRVVRLKGGDPLIFARAAEEIAACRRAAIPVEVVPGITAALGAAAELALPLTDREHSRRLHFVAGHAKDGGVPDHDWMSLADPAATTVFYMGARTFAAKLQRLLTAGLDPETPALVVSSATTPRSRQVFCRARELPRAVAGLDKVEPCLVMFGQALTRAFAMNQRFRDPEPGVDKGRRLGSRQLRPDQL